MSVASAEKNAEHAPVTAFLNGHLVSEQEAVVSVLDRGVVFGDGLFETFRVYGGRVFRWDAHLARLKEGVNALGFKLPYAATELRGFASQLIRENKAREAILRLVLTRGTGPDGYSPKGAEGPTVAMTLHPAPEVDPEVPLQWRLIQAKSYKNIFMVGLSGGGWTTTVVAALDSRITASYPVAGSVPMAMHFDRFQKNWGDWEQVEPEMYRIASYEDFYIMGSYKRSQIQVLNEFDICCFNEPRYVLYKPAIQDVLKSTGGEFDVFWAKGDILHWACPAAVDRILDDMRLRSK